MKTVTTKWLFKRSETIEPAFPDRCIMSGDAVAGTFELKSKSVILRVPYNEEFLPKVKDYRERLTSTRTRIWFLFIQLFSAGVGAYMGYLAGTEWFGLDPIWTVFIMLVIGGFGFRQGASSVIQGQILSIIKKCGLTYNAAEDGWWMPLIPGLLGLTTEETTDGYIILKLTFNDDQFADDFLALQPEASVVKASPEAS
ncbi:MAG: hypothetical protein JXQ72_11740 [Anaerolineae bacterium]|nr:hypothetical protein [Anaerolineae bacterium]